MVKLVFLCRRRPDISHDRYIRLLLEDHVPIALRHHPTMRKYVVNIVDSGPGAGLALDSIAELSFDTLEDYRQRLYDSPDGQRIVQADVARFMGGATAYAMEEHATPPRPDIRPPGGRTPGHKIITFFRPGATLAPVALADHWGQAARAGSLARMGLARYVVNVVDQVLGPDPFGWGASEELHVIDRKPARALDEAPVGTATAVLAPPASHASYRVSEYIQKLPDDR